MTLEGERSVDTNTNLTVPSSSGRLLCPWGHVQENWAETACAHDSCGRSDWLTRPQSRHSLQRFKQGSAWDLSARNAARTLARRVLRRRTPGSRRSFRLEGGTARRRANPRQACSSTGRRSRTHRCTSLPPAIFRQLTGESPMRYLTRCRPARGASYSGKPDSACSRSQGKPDTTPSRPTKAFSRHFDMAAGAYSRRLQQAAVPMVVRAMPEVDASGEGGVRPSLVRQQGN